MKNDRFFVTQIDPPLKGDKTSYDYYKGQLQLKVVDQLAERYGVDTSDAAMRATIEKFNELCDVITEIGNFRKLPNPPITGYEFHVIQLVSQVCPHDLILPYLKETLAEIKKRKPEPEFPFRARIVVAGQRDACQSHGAYRILSAAHTIGTGLVDLQAQPVLQVEAEAQQPGRDQEQGEVKHPRGQVKDFQKQGHLDSSSGKRPPL